jgi:methylated-DNA-[protein]-cysteine S-methyltransferase
MKSYSILKTKLLGELTLVANAKHLIGVYFTEHQHMPESKDWVHDSEHPILKKAGAQLEEYLRGERTTFSVPLESDGTKFQEEVWRQIARIPFGETITYSELATRAGAPEAVRAAGTATGRNPISIIVPCHRIVGKNGSLTGFGGGLERKKRLLELEMKGELGI